MRRRCRHTPTSLGTNGRWVFAFAVLALAACRAERKPEFPPAGRDVAPIVADQFSTEDARDRLGEAEEVMRLAKVGPGQVVADIGAGEGYYTVRLAPVVGRKGRVLAEDIVPEVIDRLAQRVQHQDLPEQGRLRHGIGRWYDNRGGTHHVPLVSRLCRPRDHLVHDAASRPSLSCLR